jgi:hypothetical protein
MNLALKSYEAELVLSQERPVGRWSNPADLTRFLYCQFKSGMVKDKKSEK